LDFFRSWWDWCTESFGHMFLGVTAPILFIAAFAVLVVAKGGGGLPSPPRSEIAGVCLFATPGTGEACGTLAASFPLGSLTVNTATPVLSTPTPVPRTYTVQPGDSLSLICAAEVPELAVDTCIEEVVALSDLAGPDSIVAGQSLRLPGTAAPATGSARRTPTPAATAPDPAPQATEEAEPTPEEEPEAEAAPDGTEAGEPNGEGTPESEGVEAESTPQVEAEDEVEPTATAVGSLVPLLTPLEVAPDATLPPDFDDARLYVVEVGDSVLSICFGEVPDMPADECARLVVLLNDLGGPDEIYANQGLLLP
jgi:LysM repeat protein